MLQYRATNATEEDNIAHRQHWQHWQQQQNILAAAPGRHHELLPPCVPVLILNHPWYGRDHRSSITTTTHPIHPLNRFITAIVVETKFNARYYRLRPLSSLFFPIPSTSCKIIDPSVSFVDSLQQCSPRLFLLNLQLPSPRLNKTAAIW